LANRLLPARLHARWKLDELFACDLSLWKPPQARTDIRIHWIRSPADLKPEHKQFLLTRLGPFLWRWWQRRIRGGGYRLAVAYCEGRPVHYTFVHRAGAGLKPYRPIMRSGTSIIGPCYTESSARGRGIFPYTVGHALTELQAAGDKWAFIHAATDNEASLRGIRRNPGLVYVGRFLFYRPPFGRNRMVAATIETPGPTRFS